MVPLFCNSYKTSESQDDIAVLLDEPVNTDIMPQITIHVGMYSEGLPIQFRNMFLVSRDKQHVQLKDHGGLRRNLHEDIPYIEYR
jgi:hypothetical protein